MSFWSYILQNPLALALLIYITVIILVVLIKPRALWDDQRKRYRHFGTAREETIYPLWMIAIIVGVLCYSISTVVYWVYGRSFVSNTSSVIEASASVSPQAATEPRAEAPVAPPVAPPPAADMVTSSFVVTPDNPTPQQRGGAVTERFMPRATHHVQVPQSRIWMDAMS